MEGKGDPIYLQFAGIAIDNVPEGSPYLESFAR